MDRSRRKAPKASADAAPPASSRLSVRKVPNRRRAPTTPIWSRLPKPSAIMSGCGRVLRRSLPAMIGLAVVTAIGGTAWAGYRFVTTSPRFQITAIDVRGNHHVSTDSIREALPVAVGDNVFAANTDKVTQNLTNPWIESASAHRILPHTLVVDITEYVPVAVVDLGGLYLVDAKGHPFKKAQLDGDEAQNLPIITGLDRAMYLADPAAAARTIASGLDALAQWKVTSERPTIGEIHVDSHGALTLHTYEHATAIQLGTIDLGLPARMHTFDIAWAQLSDAERARARAVHLDPRLDHVTVAFEQKAPQ